MDAARAFAREFPVLLDLLSGDWMCPGVAESEPCGGLLGSLPGGRFNDGSNWITRLSGELAVRIIDSPEFVTRFGLQSLLGVHACS